MSVCVVIPTNVVECSTSCGRKAIVQTSMTVGRTSEVLPGTQQTRSMSAIVIHTVNTITRLQLAIVIVVGAF